MPEWRARIHLSFVKRNRIVSVRVTQDEYQTLERISRERGANSVSEFLRQLIMSSEPFASPAMNGTVGVTQEINELKRKVDWLSQMLAHHGEQREAADVNRP